jgi:hypothetical protein
LSNYAQIVKGEAHHVATNHATGDFPDEKLPQNSSSKLFIALTRIDFGSFHFPLSFFSYFILRSTIRFYTLSAHHDYPPVTYITPALNEL